MRKGTCDSMDSRLRGNDAIDMAAVEATTVIPAKADKNPNN